MNNRELIYKSIDMIEDSLHSEMSIQELSEKLGFSVYYFIRLFKGITGDSPKSYMQKRKLTEAALELMNNDRKVIETAFDYGFGNHETFTRAFQKQFGILPNKIKTGEKPAAANMFRRLNRERLEHIRHQPVSKPELIESEPLCLVGMPLYYNEDMLEDLSAPWNMFINNVETITARVIPEKYYQVQYWFPNQDYGSINFFIAVEVQRLSNIPIQFTGKTLPAQKYLKFQHKGLASKVGLTYEYIYNTYLPETDYKLPHLFNFEYYPADHNDPYDENSMSEIFIPVSLS